MSRPRAAAVAAAVSCLAAPLAAETITAARGEDGLTLAVACPEAPERALIADHPVPVPAAPRARLFRYRLDGAAPAIGLVEPGADAVALRFPDGAWLNADSLVVLLPVARQRLAFAPLPEAARACGAAAPRAERRALFAAIQSALAARGLDPGPADGVFRPATGAAIAAWQSYYGLLADGVPSAALLARLKAVPSGGPSLPALRALAARVERRWRPPGWARGAWALTVPVRVRLDEAGAVLSAVADGGGRFARIARSAAEAASAAGPYADIAGIALPRDLTLHLTLPVAAADRRYARAVARRLAARAAFAGLPPAAPGGRAAALRLHIDGAARTIRTETLDPGALAPSRLARIRRAVANLPRIPPPPVDGGPNLFIMDLTLFARAPHVAPGRVAFADWPGAVR